jgi:hypothetical protein
MGAMPQTRGKKKSKRLRRRLGMLGGDGIETAAPPAAAQPRKRPAGPIMRRGWQPPFWVNALMGVGLVLFGVVFFFRVGGGGTQVLLLLAYCALGGFYLFRAVRQYQAKRRP